MNSFPQQPTPVPPQVEIPASFPSIPQDILDRFGASAVDWQRRLDEFWTKTNQAIQQAQAETARQVNSNVVYNVDTFRIYAGGSPVPMFDLDANRVRLGGVLVVDTPSQKVFIGTGNWGDERTPFYIDADGFFSLGNSLTWNPETDTLTITGTINATSGTIGGFVIGSDFIRDSANTFGLSSNVSVLNDVRFWAGDTFANRFTAPFRVYEDGTSYITLASIGVLAVNGTITAGGPAGPIGASLGNIFSVTANGYDGRSLYIAPTYLRNGFTGISAYGARIIINTASGAGTIDNAYGLYIDTVNIATNNYGLYVATTAQNYMAGRLGLNVVAPSFLLDARMTAGADGIRINADNSGGTPNLYMYTTATSGGNARNWLITSNYDAAGHFTIRGSNAESGDPYSAGTTRMIIDRSGVVRISSLAGVGTRNVVADASGNLSAP